MGAYAGDKRHVFLILFDRNLFVAGIHIPKDDVRQSIAAGGKAFFGVLKIRFICISDDGVKFHIGNEIECFRKFFLRNVMMNGGV